MKKYLILVLVVLLIGALTVGVLAGKNGQAGKSNVAHLYLYEKTPDTLTDPPTHISLDILVRRMIHTSHKDRKVLK